MAREDIKTERRRRNSEALGGRNLRLSLDESKLDRKNYVYRWVNDEPGRIQTMTTQDDWDVVTDRAGEIKQNSIGDGTQVAAYAGVGDGGTPVNAVLMRKPKAYAEEDEAAKQRRIDETEASMKQTAESGANNTYTPEGGGMKIERG